jgi:predicted metalloprotease with PDZ domain
VYDKGMLVAFLYDLTIRLKSDGKSSLEDVYHLLFARNPAEPGEGNDVIIKLLGASPATKDFSTAYIESRSKVDLQQAVVPFGLDVNSSGATTKVSVRNQLTPNQQNLLRSLGYRK